MTNHLKRGWGRGGGRPVFPFTLRSTTRHIYTSHIVSIKYGKTCAVQPNGLEHYPTDTDHTQPTRTTRTQTKKTVFEIPKSANPLSPLRSLVSYTRARKSCKNI